MTYEQPEVKVAAAAGEPVALAQCLVSIPSVNPLLEEGGQGEGAIADQCAVWLESWGFQVEVSEVAPGRFNVIAQFGGDGGTLLNGHLDTVGVSGMTVPAFGEVRGSRLYGRGSCDMKAGVAIILAAARRYAEANDPASCDPLTVALTADEEHASVGMDAFVKSGFLADRAIVCEPTDLLVMPAHKGFLWVTLEVIGRAAHGSRPEEGIDAIRNAGRILQALDVYEERVLQSGDRHSLLGHPSIHAGTITGGVAPSVYPEACQVVLEERVLPGTQVEEVMKNLESWLESLRTSTPNLTVELSRRLFRPGTEVSTNSPFVCSLLDCCEEVTGSSGVAGMTAWVDAAFLNEAGIPALCFGPGSIAQAHSADEWVELAQVRAGAAVLSRFLGLD